MRPRLVWLVILPVVLAGSELAHALANRLSGTSGREVFSSAASGRGLLPVIGAVLVIVVLGALVARARGAWWEPRRSLVVALPFAVLPPLVFVLIEGSERIAGGNSMLSRSFALGLALQGPIALAGYVLARALLRVSDAVRGLVCRQPPVPARSRRPRFDVPLDRLNRSLAEAGCTRGRAPPFVTFAV